MKLSQDDFIRTVRDTPLVAIDLIIKDKDGNILVGLRENEPARGYWFVPGGRIRKDELLRDAFLRLTNTKAFFEKDRNRNRKHPVLP